MSPGCGTVPNGLQDKRNCQRVTAGERLNGSAGMSRTEGTDGLCPSGNGAVRGPFPLRCLRGFAFCLGAAAGERQVTGSGDEPPATAIATSSLEHRGQPCSIPKWLQPVGGLLLGKGGSGDRARCLESRVSSTGEPAQAAEPRELPPGTEACEMAPNQTPFRSLALGTVGDWKVRWVFFNHYFWRYSDPRTGFMHKIGLLSQGI